MSKLVSAKEIIDTNYREYAMYVLEQRAIPSCIDGFKATARKLVCAGLDHAKKDIKVAELGGMLSRYEYHHGEVSAQSTLVGMAQDWNNNIPVFEGNGNFGSRMIQEAAAARYIFVKLSNEFNKYFTDFEVCPPHYNKDNPEPQTYLPLIPWVLVNGIKGIAVGFATDIQPRDPKDLVKAVKAELAGKNFSIPNPKFPGFNGEVVKTSDTSWQSRGIIEKSGRADYLITELPWGYDRETYFNILCKLEEDNKIEDFKDLCDDSGFKFSVKMNPTQRDKAEEDLYAYFKLTKNHNENLTTLNEKGSLQIFENAKDLIKYFVNYRLIKVRDKINYDIEQRTKELEWFTAKINFILECNKNEISKYTKADITEIAKAVTPVEEFVNKLVRLPVYELSKDGIKEINDKIDSINAEITRLNSLDERQLYLEKLNEL